MLDRWILTNKETKKIEMQGSLKEILETLDVERPEDIPSGYELTKPKGDQANING